VIVAQQQHRLEQQIVEVHGVAVEQHRLIALVGALDDLFPILAGRILGRQDHFVLGGRDAAEHLPRDKFLGVDVQFRQRLIHGGELIVGIENGVILGIGGVFALAAEHARADAVKRADLQAAQPRAKQALHAKAHFFGGLVGEGHGHDGGSRHAHFLNQIGDAIGEHAGLAAARPGQHQHWPCARSDRFALPVVQTIGDKHVVIPQSLPIRAP
jgi:hypothetical protein